MIMVNKVRWRIKDCKPTWKKLEMALWIIIIVAITSPVLAIFITFMSPSVYEATHSSAGECDIYYKGKFIPCMTMDDAFIINLSVIVCSGFIGGVILLFWPEKQYGRRRGRRVREEKENGEVRV